MSIVVKWERVGEVLIAQLDGRINSKNANELRQLLDDGIGADDNRLILDFGDVTYISSAGLRLCLMFTRLFPGPDKSFAICSLSQNNREVVEVSGFDNIMSVHDSRAGAIRALTTS